MVPMRGLKPWELSMEPTGKHEARNPKPEKNAKSQCLRLVPAGHEVASPAQVRRQIHLHLRGRLEGHRVQVGVKLR